MVISQGNFRKLVLVSLIALGGLGGALDAEATPPEAVALYNQACVASLAGQQSEALDLLQQAVMAGFDDFRFAETDPDLSGVSTSSSFQELLMANQSRLTQLSSERGFNLDSGKWTAWAELDSPGNQEQSPASLRLKWDPRALAFEIRLSGPLAEDFAKVNQSPWSGGPGVTFTLAINDGTSDFESSNTFHFMFGKNKTAGVGALYLDQNSRWQALTELTPQFTAVDDGQSMLISGSITWQSILPYHPLVDSTIGLNVAVQNSSVLPDPMALIPDPQLFSPDSEMHRFVPMNFNPGTSPIEAVVGRLNQSIVSGNPLVCDLKVISTLKGTGYLKVDFLDDQGNSVLSGEAQSLPRNFVSGVNSLSHSADFGALRLGPYLMKVELEMPSGEFLSWSSLVLNLGPDWEDELKKRIGKLQLRDQPTANFYFATVETAIKQMKNRRHPGSLTTTLLELDAFLEAGITHGSILPRSGVFLLAWNDDLGRQRLCSLYLPAGHDKAANLEAVVLWAGAPGYERRLAARLKQYCEYPGRTPKPGSKTGSTFPIYLVPHPPTQSYADLAEETSDLSGFLIWVQEYFKTEKAALAGMNSAAGAVLEFSLQKPEMLSRVLIYSGALLAPWPQFSTPELTQKFSAKSPNHPPITWIDFITETQSAGQGKLLLSILNQAGYIVNPAEEVKGGLSLTQVTDRLVLWAE
jgi:hypothetical protein